MTERWTDDELDDDFEAAVLGLEPGEYVRQICPESIMPALFEKEVTTK